MTGVSRAVAALVLGGLVAALAAGCSTGPRRDPVTGSPSPSPPTATATPTDTATAAEDGDGTAGDVPALAPAPAGDSSLWLDTIGVPVVAAVRTSTDLARLAAVDPDRREAICRQVAADLDRIAPPQVLTGLAITADAETATLLVGDLQAKGDLLAACVAGGEDLAERIAEVERTHAVAVAWLARLGGGQ